MKKLLFIIAIVAASCSKQHEHTVCYKCQAIGAGNTYNEQVCGDNPYGRLPASYSNSGGTVSWTCKEMQ